MSLVPAGGYPLFFLYTSELSLFGFIYPFGASLNDLMLLEINRSANSL